MNLYTYCENDSINNIDPSGHDAIALYKGSNEKLPIIGFAGDMQVMMQNKDGQWYSFYWMVNGVTFAPATEQELKSLSEYNKENGTKFKSSVYIAGDFSESFDYAKELYEKHKDGWNVSIQSFFGFGDKYNVLSKNCAQVTLDILSKDKLKDGNSLIDLVCTVNVLPVRIIKSLENQFENHAFTKQEYINQLKEAKKRYSNRLNSDSLLKLDNPFRKNILDRMNYIDRALMP